MDVRTGFDYHLAETRRVDLKVDGRPDHGYEAYCEACGWVGHLRGTKFAAEDDALAHDVASNPPSNR